MGNSRDWKNHLAAPELVQNIRTRESLKSQSWRRLVGSARHTRELMRAPATLVLGDFDRLNLRARNENAGFLSVSHGFMPRAPPLCRLSARFAAWDQLAAELPALHRTLDLRRRVEQLPLLDASADSLDSGELLRACALLAVVAHSYWYVEVRPPSDLPEAVQRPWRQVRERLQRRDEVLSYLDLIVYNWRLLDTRAADPFVVENMDLLLPTVGNQEERVFYLTQLEILARASPIVRLVASAQDAVLLEDDRALEAAILGVIECLGRIVRRSLLKLDPNPYSATHVNPVVWAKTVAPLAVPFRPGVQGPSGTSSPLFNTLDLFFGRKDFSSFLGREIKQLRATYPRAWQSFLGALTQVSVCSYVERSGNRALKAAWREALELYAGENGFLGRHRMKVYGYLELAFKVGRSVTIGGFGGVFTDRTWDLVDNELSAARAERLRSLPNAVHRARVVSVVPEQTQGAPPVSRVVLDVSRSPVRYQPGDRCLILPENDPALIARTLAALSARGNEQVALTDEWKAVAKIRPELAGATRVCVRDLLRFGSIRAVSPRMAEALHARTQAAPLLQQIVDGCTESHELWELLAQLARQGLDAKTLWRGPDGETSERLCRLIAPQRFRVYSISSASHDQRGRPKNTIELTVGLLRYHASEPGLGEPALRYGTASTFLTRAKEHGREIPFCIERPDRFVLPDDPRAPVVMFAGGTGIAPFRAFLQERARVGAQGAHWLLLSLRSPADFLYADELAPALASRSLELRVAFTRAGAALSFDPGRGIVVRPGPTSRIEDLMLAPDTAAALWRLIRPKPLGGENAHVFVCGRSGFARSVRETLKCIFRRYEQDGSEERAKELLCTLVAEQRLVQEIHSDTQPPSETPPRFDLSEIAEHNNAERGYWLVIDRVVYDLSEFMELHAGGRRVIQTYAGMDASHGFARAHHQRADVDAMRESYRIGVVRSYTFDDYAVTVEGPSGGVTVDCTALYRSFANALQLVVEMQNALAADQSLQTEKIGTEELRCDQTSYKLSRALETHQRFLASSLSVLVSETLPGLWRLCRGLLFPDQQVDWMVCHLREAIESEAARRSQALALRMLDEFVSWKSDPRMPAIAKVLADADAWCLAALKRALIEGLGEFERHGARTRQLGASNVKDACKRAASAVQHFHVRLAEELAKAVDQPAEPARATALAEHASPVARRLHSGTYWTLEEDSCRSLAILQRSPIALASLTELCAENERILGYLTEAHRDYGLVVDTRQAPMRNDAAFEDAMARLRSGLTSHFRRTAVLLESNVGELQVTRLERDERRHALATRSESTAFKFVLERR